MSRDTATADVQCGDCLELLRQLPDGSVDSVVTDPPYGLVFMGKAWDDHIDNAQYGAWCQLWAAECFRVLKPGGYMLAFGGSRTWHRLTCAVEDAGFEIRDSIAWLYGSGFPKSLDVSKAIDKAAGAEREVVGHYVMPPGSTAAGYDPGNRASGWRNVPNVDGGPSRLITAPATEAAQQWHGWGTALKPAFEPIVVARKPFRGTVAANVLEHGTGALNVDGCRVPAAGRPLIESRSEVSVSAFGDGLNGSRQTGVTDTGRWPPNVVLDESQAAELDRQTGSLAGCGGPKSTTHSDGMFGLGQPGRIYADAGGASRFFPVFRYQAKAPARERPKDANGKGHPTVKPLELMRWLVRLVTPPGGVVLDPFAGSGTTVEAALLEGLRCIAIEREPDYLPMIFDRIERAIPEG